jgi:ATP-dependent Lon protease
MADTTKQPKVADQPSAASHPPVPQDALIILPVRQAVLFPAMMLPLVVGRPQSIAAAQQAAREQRSLGVLLQTDQAVEEPRPEQLYRIGTTAEILRYVTAADGTHHVICRGVRRFRVVEFLAGYPYLVARVEEIGASEILTSEIEARVRLLQERARSGGDGPTDSARARSAGHSRPRD